MDLRKIIAALDSLAAQIEAEADRLEPVAVVPPEPAEAVVVIDDPEEAAEPVTEQEMFTQ